MSLENTLKALQAVGRDYRRRLGIPVVGVTGSVGKTTTREMTATALGARFRVRVLGDAEGQVDQLQRFVVELKGHLHIVPLVGSFLQQAPDFIGVHAAAKIQGIPKALLHIRLGGAHRQALQLERAVFVLQILQPQLSARQKGLSPFLGLLAAANRQEKQQERQEHN